MPTLFRFRLGVLVFKFVIDYAAKVLIFSITIHRLTLIFYTAKTLY